MSLSIGGPSVMENTEQIVYVNKLGQPTGEVAEKLSAHNAHTLLHLAFSCYVFRDSDGALLITKRAAHKKVWPNVWTNTVCSHPAPGEPIAIAIRRRAAYELGLTDLTHLECVLPEYTYQAPAYNGIVENEFCPVYIARTHQAPTANPDEVSSWRWVSWDQYADLLKTQPETLSYWAKDQFPILNKLEAVAV